MNIEMCPIQNNTDLSQFSAVLLRFLILIRLLKEFLKLLSFSKWFSWRLQNITYYQMLIHFSLEEDCLLKEKEMVFFSLENLQKSQQLCENLLTSFETKDDMSDLSI